MIESEIETLSIKERRTNSPITNEKTFPFYRYGNTQGLVAGSIMAAYLLLLQAFGFDHSPGLKMVKYLFLGLILYRALQSYRDYLPEGQLFKFGIGLGAYITVISSLVVLAGNILAYSIGDRFAFNKFTFESHNMAEVLLIDGILFFEIWVFGMILTFICLQALKSPKPAK